jgi:hypothetical protein
MPFADPRLPAPPARLPLFVEPSASCSSTSELRPSSIDLSFLPSSSRIFIRLHHRSRSAHSRRRPGFGLRDCIHHRTPPIQPLLVDLKFGCHCPSHFWRIYLRTELKGTLPFSHLLIPLSSLLHCPSWIPITTDSWTRCSALCKNSTVPALWLRPPLARRTLLPGPRLGRLVPAECVPASLVPAVGGPR